MLFLSDGLLHAIAHLWGCDYVAAKAIALEWEERQLPMQTVYALLQQRCHPRLLVDRGTENARFLDTLRRAPRMFDDLRVVHLTRHPYSVLHSGGALLRRTCVARRIVGSDEVSSGSAFDEALAAYVGATWGMTHSNVLSWLEEVGGGGPGSGLGGGGGLVSHCRVRFEDLTTEPARTLGGCCEAIGVGFEACMLRPYDDAANVALHNATGEAGVASRDPKLMRHGDQISSANSDAWRRHVPRRPLADFGANVARALGYSLVPPPPPEPIALEGGGLLELLNSALHRAPLGGAACPVAACAVAPCPVFLAAGSDGELLGFAPLARALDGRHPLYGMRVTEHVPRDTVAHAAAAYVGPIASVLGAMAAGGAGGEGGGGGC